MAAITTTGTLTAGNSRTFALAPGSALTLTLLPNCRVTVTETPETVSASDAGGNSPRTHNHQLAGVVTYGPYAMGGSVVVDNASNSGSTVTWVRKDTVVSTDSTGTALVSGDGNVILRKTGQKYPGGVVVDWSAQYGALAMVSTDAGDDVAVDTAVLFKGKPTIKCTFSNAASGTYIARYTPTNPISFKGVKSIQIPIRITCNESASGVSQEPTAAFQVWFKAASSKTWRALLTASKVPPGEWNVFSVNEDVTTYLVFSGGATWATFETETITAIDIVQTSIAASVNYPVWVGPISINAKAKGRVSIRMDGEYISQYTLIKPLLDTYGFKASLALTESLIGSSASFMTAAQINEMYVQGHECIHHTYNNTKTGGYVNATDWPSSAVITDDIKAGWDYMYAQGWTRGIGIGVEGYVPCFISTTAKARQELVYAGMKAAGMIAMSSGVGQSTFLHSLALPKEKPFYLPGTVQITSTTTPADIIAIIDRAEELGEWAIITVHRAVASGAGSLEMTTADFSTWLAYLSARVQAGGVICQPIGEVYNEFYGVTS